MSRRADEFQPTRWSNLPKVIGITVIVILTLLLLWCVRFNPVPVKFP